MGDFKAQVVANEANLIGAIIATATRDARRGLAIMAQALDLQASEFKDTRHAAAWITMRDLFARGVVPNTGNLFAEMGKRGVSVEEQRHILDLRLSAPDTSSVEPMVAFVRMASTMRRHYALGADMKAAIDAASDGSITPAEALDYIQRKLAEHDVARARTTRRFSMADIIEGARESVAMQQERGGALVGVTTGFPHVDEWTGGLQPGALTLAGALSGVGKTSLAVHLAVTAAKTDARVLLFSLEMDKRAIERRVTTHVSGLPWKQICRLSREAFDATLDSAKQLPVIVHERYAAPLLDLLGAARVEAERGDLGLIVIDHLQMVTWEGDERTPRHVQLDVISRTLQELAKALRVPIVVTCQLNPPPREKGTRAEPSSDDIRHSKEPYNNCDVFMVLHSKRDKEGPTGEDHVLVQKNRFGPVGRVRILYDYATARMREWIIDEPKEPKSGVQKELWN